MRDLIDIVVYATTGNVDGTRLQERLSREPGRMIESYFAANGPSMASEMSEELGMPRSTLNYRLKKLIAEGKVARMEPGRSRNQRYRLIR